MPLYHCRDVKRRPAHFGPATSARTAARLALPSGVPATLKLRRPLPPLLVVQTLALVSPLRRAAAGPGGSLTRWPGRGGLGVVEVRQGHPRQPLPDLPLDPGERPLLL